jgi:hypothetical protein
VSDNKIFVDSTPLDETGTSAGCKDHQGAHVDYSDKLLLADFPIPTMRNIHGASDLQYHC